MEELDRIPIFFIVGRPRSGTTLLRTLFDAHPNVNIPLECKFILDLYPKYGRKTDWTARELEDFFEDLLTQWRFNTWTIDREKLKKDLLSCEGNAPYSRICKVVYHNYRSLFEKGEIRYFGDKNPGYTIYTERLLKIFHEAKFIHIVRDYRDNFASVKEVDFELPIPSAVVTKWKLFYRKFQRASKKEPEAYTTIRYEDLVSDPEARFRELCEFIGIDYDPGVFNYYQKKDEVFKAYPKEFVTRYHANLLNKVNRDRTGIWKKKLTPREIRIADITAGGMAEKAGYERETRLFSLWFYIQALPGKGLAHALAFLTILVDKMPYRVRMTILNRGPILVARTFLRIFNPKKLKEIDKVSK